MKKLLIKLIILINRFIPKHKVNNRILVFSPPGIGDVIMFMPVLKILLEAGFDITVLTNKKSNREILLHNFEGLKFEKTGIYGWSLNNFHTVYYMEILTILRERIPNRVAHEHYLYEKFFNKRVYFTFKAGQVTQNLMLQTPFTGKFKREEMFFNVPVKTMKPYILIQPRSHTDKRKECFNEWSIILKHQAMPIVLIGSIEEMSPMDEYPKHVTNLIGRTSIIQAASLIKNCNHFYCLESGLSHIAAAVGTQTTVYYKKSVSREDALHRNLKHMNYVEII